MAWSAPRTWTGGETLTAALLNQELRDNLNAAFPVGSVHYFMQAATSVETAINGFAVEANGVAISRTTYSALNTKVAGLSYPFGSGDGSTTFNLPDIRSRALYMHGTGSGHSQVNGLGDSDGLTLANRRPSDTVSISVSGTVASTGFSVTGSPGSTSRQVSTNSLNVDVLDSVSVGSLDVGGSGSFSDTDTDEAGIAYLVAGIWAVKY